MNRTFSIKFSIVYKSRLLPSLALFISNHFSQRIEHPILHLSVPIVIRRSFQSNISTGAKLFSLPTKLPCAVQHKISRSKSAHHPVHLKSKNHTHRQHTSWKHLSANTDKMKCYLSEHPVRTYFIVKWNRCMCACAICTRMFRVSMP